MLLYHLSQSHPGQVGPYLERMRTECIATLARNRLQYPDPHDLAQRYPPRDQEHIHVRLMATNVADVIPEVVRRLHMDEGGRWPDTLPSLRFRLVGSQLEVPALKPSIFEDQT